MLVAMVRAVIVVVVKSDDDSSDDCGKMVIRVIRAVLLMRIKMVMFLEW